MNTDELEAQELVEEVLSNERNAKAEAQRALEDVFQEDAKGNIKFSQPFESLLLENDKLLCELKNVIERWEKQGQVAEEKDITALKIETAKRIQEMLNNNELKDLDSEIERYQQMVRSYNASEEFECFDSSEDTISQEDLKDEPVLFKPNFLTKGEIHILAGKAGSGKSYLATQLAASLSTGKPLLGMHCSENHKVAYLSFEDSKGRLVKRLRNIGWKDTPGLILYNDLSPLILCSGGKAEVTPLGHAIVSSLKAKNPDTIIIDTYSQAFLHDDGDNKGSQAIGNWIKKEFGGKTVLIIHHLRKAEDFKGRNEITIDAIRGASALVGYARSAFFLSSSELCELIALKSNYGEPFPKYRMDMQLEKIVDPTPDGRQVFKGFRALEESLSSAQRKMEEAFDER